MKSDNELKSRSKEGVQEEPYTPSNPPSWVKVVDKPKKYLHSIYINTAYFGGSYNYRFYRDLICDREAPFDNIVEDFKELYSLLIPVLGGVIPAQCATVSNSRMVWYAGMSIGLLGDSIQFSTWVSKDGTWSYREDKVIVGNNVFSGGLQIQDKVTPIFGVEE